MIRTANNNIAHEPPGRGACKRSTLLILASSEADPLLVGRGRYYGVGDVGCQDESYSLMVWIRLMVRRICRPLQLLLRQTRGLARGPILQASRACAYSWLSLHRGR